MVLKQPKGELVQIGVTAPELSQEVDEKVPA
jgi:hypothetical protein